MLVVLLVMTKKVLFAKGEFSKDFFLWVRKHEKIGRGGNVLGGDVGIADLL